MKNKIDLVNDNTERAIIKMVMPLLIAMILMLAYNLVDSIWVGNLLGGRGYAALTTAGSVSILLYAITTGIGNFSSHAVDIYLSQFWRSCISDERNADGNRHQSCS